jgi:hypothetical protein
VEGIAKRTDFHLSSRYFRSIVTQEEKVNPGAEQCKHQQKNQNGLASTPTSFLPWGSGRFLPLLFVHHRLCGKTLLCLRLLPLSFRLPDVFVYDSFKRIGLRLRFHQSPQKLPFFGTLLSFFYFTAPFYFLQHLCGCAAVFPLYRTSLRIFLF